MIYLKLLLTAVFWGGTFIAGRMLAGQVAPFAAAFLRFVFATTFLLIWLQRTHGRLPTLPRALWEPIALLGFSGVFAYNALFFWGLHSVAAGRAAVIVANNPVVIALGAALFFGQRLNALRTCGVLLSVTGAVFAISQGHPAALFQGGLTWGDLLIFGCVLSWGAFSLIGKRVLMHLTPLAAIAYAAVAGTLMLAVPAVAEGLLEAMPAYSLVSWASIAYLGLCGTVIGFVWYYKGIERIGPTRAALFINFVPLSAIVLAYLLLGEPITWSLAGGAAMVLTGVYLTNAGQDLRKAWRKPKPVAAAH